MFRLKKSVGITISNNSYTPEAYAYADYLRKYGVEVQLDQAHMLDPLHDTHIYFMGLLPFWKKKGSWREVHEYQSLSTPNFARTKDLLKKVVNRKPDGRIILNDTVRNILNFKDSVPYILRDMGVDDALFQRPSKNPTFDIVYCGSINGRVGLVEQIIRLAELGFKVLVIGSVTPEVKSILSSAKYNIELAGRVQRKDLPELYRNCRAGLNYTPNIYPFNIQTSTKTLEYLASGLGVISNRYCWSEEFFSRNSGLLSWLSDLVSISDIRSFETPALSFGEYSWGCKLRKIQFLDFVMEPCIV